MDSENTIDTTLKLQECLQSFIERVEQLRNEDDPSGDGFSREFRVRVHRDCLKTIFKSQNFNHCTCKIS